MTKPVKYLTPRIMEAFFIVALQRFFAEHPEYPWSSDRKSSKIYIQADIADDSRQQNIHPAIIVESSGASIGNDSVGNMSHFNIIKDYLTELVIQMTVNGAISIHCIAESKISAVELAFETAMFLQGVRTTLGSMLQAQYTNTPSISGARQYSREGSVTTYVSTVSVSYSFTVGRKVTPLDPGPLLAEINYYLDMPASAGTPNSGGIGGTYTGGNDGNWGGIGGGNYPSTGGPSNADKGDLTDDMTMYVNPVINSTTTV